jgi:DnaJ-class molecular chaperone
MGKDYYGILGVPRNADTAALRKAYHDLAMKWHPDKNPGNVAEAQSRFQDISEAFNVLRDPEKRRIYDQSGEEGVCSFSPDDVDDLFQAFFGGDFFFSGFGFPFDEQESEKPEPYVVSITCTLEQLFSGETRKLKITRTVHDRLEEKILQVVIQPGMKDGTRITFAGEGDHHFGQRAQDIVVVIQQQPHAYFTREKDDLVVKFKIKLRLALCGTRVTCKGIDGRPLELGIHDIIAPGSEWRILREGMPREGGGRGDVVVRFDVLFPSSLHHETKQAIKRLLSD